MNRRGFFGALAVLALSIAFPQKRKRSYCVIGETLVKVKGHSSSGVASIPKFFFRSCYVSLPPGKLLWIKDWKAIPYVPEKPCPSAA